MFFFIHYASRTSLSILQTFFIVTEIKTQITSGSLLSRENQWDLSGKITNALSNNFYYFLKNPFVLYLLFFLSQRTEVRYSRVLSFW